MHHGRLSHSPRLQRVLKALRAAKGEISSLELTQAAASPAVGTCISELRANGAEISCRSEVRDGVRVFLYTMTKEPTE